MQLHERPRNQTCQIPVVIHYSITVPDQQINNETDMINASINSQETQSIDNYVNFHLPPKSSKYYCPYVICSFIDNFKHFL